MKLYKLVQEMMIREEPSIQGSVELDVAKEVQEMQTAIVKYEESAIEQLIQTLKPKLIGKTILYQNQSIQVKDIKISNENQEFNLVVITSESKEVHINGKIQIQNDSDAPVPNASQNKARPSNTSQHKITQF